MRSGSSDDLRSNLQRHFNVSDLEGFPRCCALREALGLTTPVTAIIDSATGNYLREKTYVSFHPLQAYRSVKWEVCDDRLSTHQWLILRQPIN